MPGRMMKMIRYAALLACAAVPVMVAAQTAPTEVTIESGRIRGAVEGDVLAWKGIPFAKPPIGENRWRAPQPIRWSGVKLTTDYGHDCMQKPFPSDAAPLGTEPSEDCLVMNVWRPVGAPANAKLPVMVWIYGGGFVNGGSSPAVYSGAKFAEQGIMFVSFNYRLGRFGFFAHPALTAAREGMLGNYAYMDQVAALQWVKRNAASFGGDAGNVTVIGESAGGGSAINVLTSPVTRGLFNRVVVMSGGGRAPLLPARKISVDQPQVPSAETIGLNFAKSVGVDGTGPDALRKLRALSADQVLQGLSMMQLFVPPGGLQTYVGGPIEDGTIVTGTPQSLLEAGRQAPVPVMIGTTSADIGFGGAPTKDALFATFGAAAAADRGMTEPARYVAGMVARAGQPAYYYRFSYVADSVRDAAGRCDACQRHPVLLRHGTGEIWRGADAQGCGDGADD
ncbi:carboxylesterase/lipase family protein [Sphingomonas prati]|nr:carboxylesterase family protein [Sphingomonas prati]